jgi:hypothetical protein
MAPVSALSAFSLPASRAASVTDIPFFARSRASEALNPGPAPTINADLCVPCGVFNNAASEVVAVQPERAARHRAGDVAGQDP